MQYPPNPQTINFDLSEPHSLTEDGQQFLILDEMEDQERILIFSSNAQMRIMLQSECLHMDGTFKSCPDLFNQVYIIHGYHRGESLPVCYALMTNRTANSYAKMFRALKIRALTISPRGLNPASIITDYEPAIKAAIELEFPLTTHYGCYFHMCQALLRYVSQNGLLINLRENNDFAENFRLKCISALFPRNNIPLLINLIDEVHPAPEEFKRYFSNNWLPKVSMISCFERITRRTNNPSEGYNSGFNNKIPRGRKNFWAFLLVIQQEEKYCRIRIQKLDDGVEPRQQKPRFIRRDNALLAWKAAFDEADLLYEARKARRIIAEN